MNRDVKLPHVFRSTNAYYALWQLIPKNNAKSTTTTMKETYSIISPKLAGGPKGLGDPDDKSLRKVEKDVLIPKLMREKAKTEKCINEVKEFHDCCLKSGLLNVIKCRMENEVMKSCLEKWYYNQDFIKECTEQYLNERSEFRRTGIPKKKRTTRIETSI